MQAKRFDSSEGNVWKYVFDFEDAISEAVLYKYEEFYKRTVLCISVQSGCPVGCTFCGTGNKFIRNLTYNEIISQVTYVLKDMNIEDVDLKSKRFQIMFMSMGEPMLNIDNVSNAIVRLGVEYPNADLLVSTVGIKNDSALRKLFMISDCCKKVGLQFSVHNAFDNMRDILIPYKNKMNLREIRDTGIEWNKITGRPVYLNYCVDNTNQTKLHIERLKDLFPPNIFYFTFSVTCSPDETMKEKGYRNLNLINDLTKQFLEDGYNVRVFDPAGQDDIGGGCGQLFHVQRWMNKQVTK